MKIGLGYDIHRLAKGNGFILGGVKIKSNKKVIAHSDGDVLCHAIADAILGAANSGDIGKHFSNKNPIYKNISSLILLEEVLKIIKKKKFRILNVDSTIILQEPKIGSYSELMSKNIAKALKIKPNQVSIKATTNEMLDAIGNKKGISAFSIALLK